jgi:hypothetical protein
MKKDATHELDKLRKETLDNLSKLSKSDLNKFDERKRKA